MDRKCAKRWAFPRIRLWRLFTGSRTEQGEVRLPISEGNPRRLQRRVEGVPNFASRGKKDRHCQRCKISGRHQKDVGRRSQHTVDQRRRPTTRAYWISDWRFCRSGHQSRVGAERRKRFGRGHRGWAGARTHTTEPSNPFGDRPAGQKGQLETENRQDWIQGETQKTVPGSKRPGPRARMHPRIIRETNSLLWPRFRWRRRCRDLSRTNGYTSLSPRWGRSSERIRGNLSNVRRTEPLKTADEVPCLFFFSILSYHPPELSVPLYPTLPYTKYYSYTSYI